MPGSGPNLITDERCPFCLFDLKGGAVVRGRDNATAHCPVCGTYRISGTAIDLIGKHWVLSDEQRLAMAFVLRRMTENRPEQLVITSNELNALRDTASLPAPETLLDEAIRWFGQHSQGVGHMFQVDFANYRTILGTLNSQAFVFVTDWMLSSEYFDGVKPNAISPGGPISISNCRLTPTGWSRYAELSKSRAQSRQGFMAMRYGDAELDALVTNYFTPEVRKTGFELRRLDQAQPAGLIDDQLRVMIRTSRFMVCDLTHGNRGAYWEAGYAEGLGRPVIYTCRKDIFEDRRHEHHPHFDTNHMVTVIWDPVDPPAAARRLKDTIRATLPSEAVLTD